MRATYVTILRAVFLKGSSFGDLAVPIRALLLYAAVIMWLAARAFQQASGLARMFERLRVMLMKEFLQLRRDRWAMFRLIVPLIIQVLVFGYAANFHGQSCLHRRARPRPQPGEPRPDLAFRRDRALRHRR